MALAVAVFSQDLQSGRENLLKNAHTLVTTLSAQVGRLV